MFKGISALDSEEVIITLIFITLLLIWIFRKLPHIGEGVIATLVPIAILLVCILWNRILIKIVIKKITKTENQKMFKQEETPVLDTKQLFKQTAWKSIGFRLLAMVIAVGATVCSIFVAVMLYDVNQKLTWHIEFFGSLRYEILWSVITFPTVFGVMIYLFNKKWTFSGTELTLERKKKISRYLAFFSFPHVILLPAAIIVFYSFMVLD